MIDGPKYSLKSANGGVVSRGKSAQERGFVPGGFSDTMNSMTQVLTFTADRLHAGERLDKLVTDWLAPTVTLSRGRVQELIKGGYVTVGPKTEKPSYRVEVGDVITVQLAAEIVAPPDANAGVLPEALPLSILYDDPSVAAIDKAAGMVVHPGAGHESGTLVNAILARWPQVATVGGENRAGIVHRLDKDTSGVILIAKTEAARLHLMAQFAGRTVQKRYLALVEGIPNTTTGEIDAPIGRDPDKRKQMAVMTSNRGGREAISRFTVLERFGEFALLEVYPKTGRTHQIRVHLAFIGHPIVGDGVYGPRKQKIKLGRHFLHAESLTFTPPDAAAPVTVHAPLPPELTRVLDRLRG